MRLVSGSPVPGGNGSLIVIGRLALRASPSTTGFLGRSSFLPWGGIATAWGPVHSRPVPMGPPPVEPVLLDAQLPEELCPECLSTVDCSLRETAPAGRSAVVQLREEPAPAGPSPAVHRLHEELATAGLPSMVDRLCEVSAPAGPSSAVVQFLEDPDPARQTETVQVSMELRLREEPEPLEIPLPLQDADERSYERSHYHNPNYMHDLHRCSW